MRKKLLQQQIIQQLTSRYRKYYMNTTRDVRQIELFDVTLRDGLQSTPTLYSLSKKKELLDTIISKESPTKIEVGSLVSEKIVPQMKDSLELYKYAVETYKNHQFFLLIPNMNSLENAISNDAAKNISIPSSVSSSFQYKNLHMTIDDTKKMIQTIPQYEDVKYVKVYLSCVHRCPFEGDIPLSAILNEIDYYAKIEHINELCISDTMANLDSSVYMKIIDHISQHHNTDKFSFHFHVEKHNRKNPKHKHLALVLRHASRCNITKYDVSYLPNIGGCVTTLGRNKNGNITYQLLHDILNDFIYHVI